MDLELLCRARLADLLGCGEADVLMHHVDLVTLADGERIFAEGAPSGALYLVCEGEVMLTMGTEEGSVPLGVVEVGNWLGEIGFVEPGPSSATATARGPCTLAKLEHDTLVRLVDADPVLAGLILAHVNRDLATRLRRSTTLIVEHLAEIQARGSAPGRWVAQALGRLIGGEARKT